MRLDMHLERYSLNIYRSEKCLDQKTNKLLPKSNSFRHNQIKVNESATIVKTASAPSVLDMALIGRCSRAV
jgi:hypothetical protein